MMGEGKHDPRTVFTAAVALRTPQERARYLDEACQGKPELRQRVEALLRAHEQAAHFLEVNGPDPDALREGPGTVIGRYKLLEEIGDGAFGRVFMAEQTEPVRRKVALKIIKVGMDTREVVARFEAERQALALMDHPNIAKVLDAGATETGRPYFVMELVRGIPITGYCEQQQLSTAERLQLFMKVCHAVQHAHQKGIIHRDLKPTNILVTLIDGEAVPKVIDFGVAKALGQKLTEKTLFTGFQQMIGTPAYMSPEQAALSGVDVDTRSDIYSLGVLLYELLTGVTPFDQETFRKAALDEICRFIRETEPPKPSTRLTQLARSQRSEVRSQKWKEVRGDLDWIVMKCLEKDRARRYETANSLAEDIGHHLKLEPVNAAAPGTFYRARKFIHRHRAGVAMASALVFLLVTGAVVSAWQAVRATRAERAQALLRQQAQADKKEAQTEAQKSQQVAQFLKDMLQGVEPSVAVGRDTTMLREILDKTAARLGKDLKDQPGVEAELRDTLGWVYYDLGEDHVAESFHRDTLALRRKLRGNESRDVADSLHGLGLALWRQGKLVEAETTQREALAIRRKLLGNDNLDTARSLNDLALVLLSQGESVEAEPLVQEALFIRRKLLKEPHADMAHSLNLLALTFDEQGKLAEAESVHRETLAMRQSLFGNKHPDVAFSLGALGAVLAREGKLAEAESLLRESVARQRELSHSDHPDSLMARYSLATLLAREGKQAELAELCGKPAGSDPAETFNSIAWPLATCVHALLRDGTTAALFAERAVAATERTNAIYLNTLAAAYAETGQFAKAVSAQKEAIALLPEGKQKEDCRARLTLYGSNSRYREAGAIHNKE